MRLPAWVPIALAWGLIALAAGGLLFSTFMVYDDEGYVLYSLQTFVTGGGLYERVYTQYGPFFYVFNQLLHLAGWEFTNASGRVLTFFCWLGAAGFSSAIVWRMTRSTAATVFTLGAVFFHLWPMTSEPSHPGGLIVLLVAALAWLGAQWCHQPGRLAVAVGGIGAALFLTKINVGIFLFAGAGVWWALHLDDTKFGLRTRLIVMAIAMTLLPLGLMRGNMALGWVQIFALVAASAGLATTIAAGHRAAPITRWRDFATAAIAALAVGAITCGLILLQGTTLKGLLDGVILGPLRHPQVYSADIKWRPAVVPVAIVSLALAFWCTVRPRTYTTRLVDIGRLLAVTLFVGGWVVDWPINTQAFAMSYALSAVWLLIYSGDGEQDAQPVRAWLGLLTVTQALHAYPVGGSQISWGTFLWVPLATIAAHGTLRRLAAAKIPLLRCGAIALILLALCRTASLSRLGVTRLQLSDTLGLPGTTGIRLPEATSTAVRIMARNAVAHADVLFSLPGMHSFHLWTDLPPPTSINATHWFTLLTGEQQQAIQQRLEASPRSCVIFQKYIYDYLVDRNIPVDSPLTQWLKSNYEPAFQLETYQFWVRRGRKIAAIGTATAREAEHDVTPRYQLVLTLAEAALPEVTAIEFDRFTGDITTPELAWTNDTAELYLTPITSDGRPTGASRKVTFPFDASGLMQVEIRTNKVPAGLNNPGGVFTLRNRAGDRLAEARLIK